MPKPSVVPVDTPPTFAEVLAEATPMIRRTKVCLRGDLMAQLEALQEEFLAVRNDEKRTTQLAAKVTKLTEEARARETEFVFQCMGRRAWRELVAQHPPTTEQQIAGADYNTQSMPPVAMAASCIAPTGATLQTFEELGERVTEGQWNQLWSACHAANTGSGEVPFSALAFSLAAAQRQA